MSKQQGVSPSPQRAGAERPETWLSHPSPVFDPDLDGAYWLDPSMGYEGLITLEGKALKAAERRKGDDYYEGN
jgi:hypothetical protein